MKSEAGSNLIAMAVLTLIIGFLIVGGLFLMQNYNTIHSDQSSISNSRDVEDALANFVALYGRYPCPAVMDARLNTADFGVENCSGVVSVVGRDSKNVLIGTVPVRTLNMPEEKIVDGYGKRYTYAITQDVTVPGVNVKTEYGAITIHNKDGDSISDIDGHVIYAVMSHNEEDRGAYDIEGNLLQPCNGPGLAISNCDNADATFITSQKELTFDENHFSNDFSFKASSVPNRWHATEWSACQGDCFVGTQNRVVTCRNYKNEIVADETLCSSHTPKPTENRDCGLPPCIWRPTCSGATTCPPPPTCPAGETLMILTQGVRDRCPTYACQGGVVCPAGFVPQGNISYSQNWAMGIGTWVPSGVVGQVITRMSMTNCGSSNCSITFTATCRADGQWYAHIAQRHHGGGR